MARDAAIATVGGQGPYDMEALGPSGLPGALQYLNRKPQSVHHNVGEGLAFLAFQVRRVTRSTKSEVGSAGKRH